MTGEGFRPRTTGPDSVVDSKAYRETLLRYYAQPDAIRALIDEQYNLEDPKLPVGQQIINAVAFILDI